MKFVLSDGEIASALGHWLLQQGRLGHTDGSENVTVLADFSKQKGRLVVTVEAAVSKPAPKSKIRRVPNWYEGIAAAVVGLALGAALHSFALAEPSPGLPVVVQDVATGCTFLKAQDGRLSPRLDRTRSQVCR